MRFGLEESTIARIVAVFRAHPLVEEVIIYGSRAMECHKPGSDIDLTLKGEKITLQELNKMAVALDDLLLPYTFDLSAYRQIDNQELLEHIKRVGKSLHKKQRPGTKKSRSKRQTTR